MDFQGKTVLVFLEEDNIQRAYFRVRPLLTAEEEISAEALTAYPDDGYLRIVPDKNEQHTFKDRMRTMCGLCVVDLTGLPADTAKIRSNKNYSPERGETNQFIIYSDAVREMPEALMYQVVPEDEIRQAHTPLVYKRDGANITGPFRRADGEPQGESRKLPPDSEKIHAVTLPGGKELLFFWPKPVREAKPAPVAAPAFSAPVPEEKPAQLSAPAIIERLNETPVAASSNLLKPALVERPLDDSPAASYNGTKLYQPAIRRPAPKRAYNPLIETVEQQRYAARYESPGAVLGDAGALREVDNPVEKFRISLQSAWNDANTHQQTASIILSMPGMRALLAKLVTSEHSDLAIAAMHAQLNDLEAERLMTLMRLDEAKNNLAALKKDALAQATREEQAALEKTENDLAAARTSLDVINTQLEGLTAKRAELAEQINKSGELCVLSPVRGQKATRREMIARVRDCLAAQGFDADEDDACAALILFAQSEGDLCFRSGRAEDALLAAQAFAHALGSVLRDLQPCKTVAERTADDAPELISLCSIPAAALIDIPGINGVTRCYHATKDDMCAPMLALAPKPYAFPAPLPACPPVSERVLRQAMLADPTELNAEAAQLIRSIREVLAAAKASLPLALAGKLREFVAVAQNIMKGGVAAALDLGVSAYVLPHMKANRVDANALSSLLSGLPRTLRNIE